MLKRKDLDRYPETGLNRYMVTKRQTGSSCLLPF
jgi:hypothetical protein